MGLTFRAFSLNVNSTNGEYAFSCEFNKKLNIIKGNNTSGKSTLINSLLYSIGMEELLGARNESVLQYAVRTKLKDGDNEYDILSSVVYLEISNAENEIVTLRRYITSESKNSKLIEVIHGPFLTKGEKMYEISPMFLHDPGSAQSTYAGYYKFLESFLGLQLPIVPNNQGGEVKLYLQTLFAAFFIEQKSGWTDYIANIPYYKIKNVTQKVIEYLLGFNVFENERLKNDLQKRIAELSNGWRGEALKIRALSNNYGFKVSGISDQIDDSYNGSLVYVVKVSDEKEIQIDEYLNQKLADFNKAEYELASKRKESIRQEKINDYDGISDEIDRLMWIYRDIDNQIHSNRQSLNEYSKTKVGIEKDIEKNSAVMKVKKLGFSMEISLSKDLCPTCHQNVADSLIEIDDKQVMSLEENIQYLKSQKQMIERYCSGQEKLLESLESQKSEVNKELNRQNELLQATRKEIRFGDQGVSETLLRKKIHYENEIKNTQQFIELLEESKEELKRILDSYFKEKVRLKELPSEYLSQSDKEKLNKFQKNLKKYADVFGFSSTGIDNIVIDEEKYTPFMIGDVLKRAIRSEADLSVGSRSDLRHDSSASDFVRLIWSFILSLYNVSRSDSGNHPGIVIFDEPAQHSMAIESFHNLLRQLQDSVKLQSIVAASFDESTSVFRDATKDITYNLINIPNKLLTKSK